MPSDNCIPSQRQPQPSRRLGGPKWELPSQTISQFLAYKVGAKKQNTTVILSCSIWGVTCYATVITRTRGKRGNRMEEVGEGQGGNVGHGRQVGGRWRKNKDEGEDDGDGAERKGDEIIGEVQPSFSDESFSFPLCPGIKEFICPFLPHLELLESPFWPLYTLITSFIWEEGAIFCSNPLIIPSFLNKTFRESTHHYAQCHPLSWPCPPSQRSSFFFCICIHVTMANEQILARRSPLPVCKTKTQDSRRSEEGGLKRSGELSGNSDNIASPWVTL